MNDADRELVERVASGMGWDKRRFASSWAWYATAQGDYACGADWNPLTDANADLQVLEHVRGLGVGSQEAVRMRYHFGASLLMTWERRSAATGRSSAHLTVAWYERGDYARAFDAVLTSTAGEDIV
jgi:hypothetical protein